MTRTAVILGCPRSGTTFLADALRPMPRAEVVSGLIFPPAFAHLAGSTDDDAVRRVVGFGLQWAIADFARHASESRTWAAGQLMGGYIPAREARAAVGGRRAIDLVVLKEPFLALCADVVTTAVPGVRVVHIHRDGRDAADSLQRTYGVLSDERLRSFDSNEAPVGRMVDGLVVPWWVDAGDEEAFIAAPPYVRSVWLWRSIIRRVMPAAGPGVTHDAATLHVRYEDLISDGEGVGRQIVDHIGGAWSAAVARRLLGGHPRSIGVYRRRPHHEVTAADDLAGAELTRLGYQVG